MNFDEDDLKWAAARGLITDAQAEALRLAFEGRGAHRARFDLAHVAYYFGALVVLGAMGWFMARGWESLGGFGLSALAALYALLFALAGRTLWFREGLRVPGGLLFTLAVCMTPLAVHGLERALGLWPQGPWGSGDYHVRLKVCRLAMEAATVAAALAALRFVRFPLLTFPAALALWYVAMDLTPLLFGRDEFTWDERLWVSLVFGLALLAVAFLIDRRTREDYAFWLYLFGATAFWGGLSLMGPGSEAGKFCYFLINVALVLLSVLLERRALLVYGVLGVSWYLVYLSQRVFRDSLLFPVVLSLVGVGIIYLGVKYQRNRERVGRAVRSLVPEVLRRLLPQERARGA
jgi:hypothetical protein